MKYNIENAKKRLESVPKAAQVWIYNADIIIEFLNSTLMPTNYFLKHKGLGLLPGNLVPLNEYTRLNDEITMEQLYKFYLMFREQHDYTSPIETKFKFSIIIKKLRFYKNNWEFVVGRKGRRQVVTVAPALLRSDLTDREKIDYPVNKKQELDTKQVEVEAFDIIESNQEVTFENKVEKIWYEWVEVE